MKYLVTDNFKISRKGSKVQADEAAGEWIYDSETSDLTVAQIEELAQANKLKLDGKKKAELSASLQIELETLNIPQVEKIMSEEYVEIVKAGLEAEKGDDEIMIDLALAGCPFKTAGKVFKDITVSLGLRISSKDRKEKIFEHLSACEFAPENWGELDAKIEEFVKTVEDTNYSQAYAQIRSWAKTVEVALPKPEKKKIGGFKAKMQDWMLNNYSAETSEYAKWLSSEGKDEKAVARLIQAFDFAKKFAATANGAK